MRTSILIMKTKEQIQIDEIKKYLKQTRKELNKCLKNDYEYNTLLGNGVNCHEASSMFDEVEEAIKKILKGTTEKHTNEA